MPEQQPRGDMRFHFGIFSRLLPGSIAVKCLLSVAGIALGIYLRVKQQVFAVRTEKNSVGFCRNLCDLLEARRHPAAEDKSGMIRRALKQRRSACCQETSGGACRFWESVSAVEVLLRRPAESRYRNLCCSFPYLRLLRCRQPICRPAIFEDRRCAARASGQRMSVVFCRLQALWKSEPPDRPPMSEQGKIGA